MTVIMPTGDKKNLGKTVYINARLIDPASGYDGPGGVITTAETIQSVGPDITASSASDGTEIVDCNGLCLCPGLVDFRVQLGSLDGTCRAAASGGITSLVTLPDMDPVIDDPSIVEFIARRARKLGLAKVYVFGAATKALKGEHLNEYGLLNEAGALGFSDGLHSIQNAQVMRQILSYAATFDLLVACHPENAELAANGVATAGELTTRLGLTGIPIEAEVIHIDRDLRILEMTGGRLHINNVSTIQSVLAIKAAKQKGLNITCDTAPPYFALNDGAINGYRTFAKLSPPLRPEPHREAIIQAIKDGTIDIITSDHTPRDEESKRLPFSEAAVGGVGLNTLLPVSLDLYHNGVMELIDVIALLTHAPARLLNLDVGRLTAGRPADMVLFDPDRGWKVSENTLYSKSKNSPFDGRPVQGQVMLTIVDGRPVFKNEKAFPSS